MSARRLLGFVVAVAIAGAVAGGESNGSLPTTEPPAPPPGVPAAGPDTAPLPQGTNTPAWDAIRQRCAIAIDERSCIEAARRDEARRMPAPPPH